MIILICIFFAFLFAGLVYTLIKRRKHVEKLDNVFSKTQHDSNSQGILLIVFSGIGAAFNALPPPKETSSGKYKCEYLRFNREVEYLHSQIQETCQTGELNQTNIDKLIMLIEDVQETLNTYAYLKDRFYLEVETSNPEKNDVQKIRADSQIQTVRRQLLQFKHTNKI